MSAPMIDSDTDLVRRLREQDQVLRLVNGVIERVNPPHLIALFLEAADRIEALSAQVEALTKERDEALAVLRDHHKWHAESGVIGLPDGDGGWIEMDNAAEYGDSRLYDRTAAILSLLPPRIEPMPRGGWKRGSTHWEDWQLAYRQLKAEHKRAEAAEARVRELVTTGTALLDKLSLEDDEGLLEHAEPVIRFRTALRNQNKDGDK